MADAPGLGPGALRRASSTLASRIRPGSSTASIGDPVESYKTLGLQLGAATSAVQHEIGSVVDGVLGQGGKRHTQERRPLRPSKESVMLEVRILPWSPDE